MAAGRVYHWKHGWIPISPEALAMTTGRKRKLDVVKATVANQKLLDAEMTAQGLAKDHPMRGVLSRQRGTHLIVARQGGKIVGGIAMNVNKPDVGISEVRVLNADQHGGVGTELIREAARATGKHGDLRVYGAVDSAKPFYAKTGATFTPDSNLGVWSPEAVAALKAGETPPPGIVHTPVSYFAQELERVKREYPDYYREKYGSLPPLEAAKKFGRFGPSGGNPVVAR